MLVYKKSPSDANNNTRAPIANISASLITSKINITKNKDKSINGHCFVILKTVTIFKMIYFYSQVLCLN